MDGHSFACPSYQCDVKGWIYWSEPITCVVNVKGRTRPEASWYYNTTCMCIMLQPFLRLHSPPKIGTRYYRAPGTEIQKLPSNLVLFGTITYEVMVYNEAA